MTALTILLFDIDGTLVDSGGAGRRAMAGAFLDVTSNAEACSGIAFAGMTDRAIVRAGLLAIGEMATDTAIDAVLEAYLARLEREITASPGYRILPGITDVLGWLGEEPGVAIGLGTGNVKRGAYTKLSRGGIDGAFRFGGFGCDAEDRAELLRAGARRGAEALGRPLVDCRVVVIGDTPKDVAAALAMGAACVGVGTGGFTATRLRELGARHAFDTLEDAGVREALLAE